MCRLKLTLQGIKHETFVPQHTKLPISASLLHDMCVMLDKGLFGKYLDTLMSTVLVTGWFGAMRCAEFTAETPFDPKHNLALGDVSLSFHQELDKQCLTLTLK